MLRRVLATASLCLLAVLAAAQDDVDQREIEEQARQQAFRDGMTQIVEDLNRGSFARLVAAMDVDATLDAIYGLRLIDTRMKRDFSSRMKQPGQFEGFITSQFQAEAADGIRARLLTVESRGDRGRAVVRFDMAYFQANYLDFDLRLDDENQLVVTDWTDYGWGQRFTDRVGLAMIVQQPSENAVRKLVDFPSVQQAQLFQIMEVLKATRDRKLDRYWQIVDNMDEEMRRQRVIWKLGLDTTKEMRKRRDQRKVLEGIDKYYPTDVLFSLSLLDYYFPDRQYQKAYDALVRVRDKLRVDDGLTNARLSSAVLVQGKVDDAVALAEKATEQEPELELGWWSLLRAQAVGGNYEDVVNVLDKLGSNFGYEFNAEMLSKDPDLRAFLASDEFKAWQQSHGPTP